MHLSGMKRRVARFNGQAQRIVEKRMIFFLIFFDFGFCYIYLESLTLASASCRQTIVLGADSAIGIEPSL